MTMGHYTGHRKRWGLDTGRRARRGQGMTMREFIRENRAEIEAIINGVMYRHDGRGGRGVVPSPAPAYTVADIREWIANEETLYQWARGCGVRV